ncbi:hypothetical protein [Streptomyces sp. NPDC092952]|uniref:hypothetical protein n=1 Tax=Streptomyces sp. NPDC092952 TaxID=3366018 RepID=UPI00381331BC
MLYVVVNGLWGPRAESVGSVAERWSGTLAALRDIDAQTFDVWHEAGDDLPSDPVLEPSAPALAEYIERRNTGPDLDVVGYTSSSWARNPKAAYVSLTTHAGGTSRYAPHSVSLVFRSREVDETAEVIRRTPEILRVLAEHWEIDAGQVYDKAVDAAVTERFDLENSAPRCGRAVFLSAGRAARAPEDLPGTYVRTADGGLVVDLTYGGTKTPDIGTVIEVNERLREAGALEKLPVPFDRDRY